MEQETLEEVIFKKYPRSISEKDSELRNAFIEGAKWQQEVSQHIVPFDAYNIEVFKIEADENGELFAYIGYRVTNGNFHFSVVPFTEPQQDKNKYSEEELIEFSEWISHNDWVYLPKKSYWVNEEQEELEQKFTTKELFEKFKKQKRYESILH